MKKETWSLASRIVTHVMLVVSCALFALGMSLAAFTRYEVTERLDNSLEEVAERLQNVVEHIPYRPEGHDIAWLPDVGPRTLAYQVVDDAGNVIIRSQNAPLTPFVEMFRTPGFSDGRNFRVYVASATVLGYHVMVGEPYLHRNEAILRAILISIVPLILCLPLIWLLVRWSVSRAMHPLEQLQNAMQLRDSGNLEPIPALNLPQELLTIQTATNTLLGRLAVALKTERAFAASAAHELRNPLAALQAQMQMLVKQLDDNNELKQRGLLIVEKIRAFGRTVEKLLQFSRASSGVAYQRERVDLIPVLRFLCDELNSSPNVRPRLRMETSNMRSLFVMGDMDAIAILMRNLFENAVLHSVGPAPVSISIRRNKDIIISNTCRPLSQEALNKLSRPFVRGRSDTAGSGLGLAIVHQIAAQMDASVQILTHAHESQFVVRVQIQKITP